MRNSNDHAKSNDKSFGARTVTALKSAAQRGKRLIEMASGTPASNVALVYGSALVLVPVTGVLAHGLSPMLGLGGPVAYAVTGTMYLGALAAGLITTGFLANGALENFYERSERKANQARLKRLELERPAALARLKAELAAQAKLRNEVHEQQMRLTREKFRGMYLTAQSATPRSAMNSISPSVTTSGARPATAQSKSDRLSL